MRRIRQIIMETPRSLVLSFLFFLFLFLDSFETPSGTDQTFSKNLHRLVSIS